MIKKRRLNASTNHRIFDAYPRNGVREDMKLVLILSSKTQIANDKEIYSKIYAKIDGYQK